jgi:hypothetical protein
MVEGSEPLSVSPAQPGSRCFRIKVSGIPAFAEMTN